MKGVGCNTVSQFQSQLVPVQFHSLKLLLVLLCTVISTVIVAPCYWYRNHQSSNFMYVRPSEAYRFAVSQEIPSTSQNLKVHYCGHKMPPRARAHMHTKDGGSMFL